MDEQKHELPSTRKKEQRLLAADHLLSMNYNVNSGPRKDTDPVRPRESDADSDAELQDQDPGETQRRNQGDEQEDPLAA
jgi:hypothetical protein